MKKIIKKYSFLIGLAIFGLIITRLDLSQLTDIFAEINYLYLLLAIAILPPLLAIKAYRWNYLKKKQKIYYSFKESFLIYNVGFYIGMITPARFGEIIKVIYLKKDNHNTGQSLASVVLDRIFDVVFLLFFGSLGMIFFIRLFKEQIVFIFLFLLFIIILLLLIKSKWHKVFMKKFFYLIVPTKYQKSWKLYHQDFISSIKNYKVKNYIYAFVITFFSWIAYYVMAYFSAKSIDINEISFFVIAVTATISALATMLPISILGLGTREASIILVFSIFGISPETALSFSFLILFLNILTALIGFASWVIKPIPISN